jgi:hypothetical protein
MIQSRLTVKGAQNSTQTMCGAPVRDITHVTPIVTGISGAFAIIGVLARCIASAGSLQLDDIFAIAALISALPMGILEFFMSADGFGKDIWTIEPKNIYRIVQVRIVSGTLDSLLTEESSHGSPRSSTSWQWRSRRYRSSASVFAYSRAKNYGRLFTHLQLSRWHTGLPLRSPVSSIVRRYLTSGRIGMENIQGSASTSMCLHGRMPGSISHWTW